MDSERKPSLTSHLLSGRWLYLALGAVVAVLYLHVLYLHLSSPRSQTPSEQSESLAEQAASLQKRADTTALIELDMEPSKLLELFLQKRGVATVLVLWVLLTLGLAIAGIMLSVQVVWKRQLIHLFRYRSRLPRVWSLKDVGRLLLLMVLIVGMLPFVQVSFMVWGFSGFTDPRLWSLTLMLILEGWLFLIVWGLASTKGVSLSFALGLSWRRGVRGMVRGLMGYIALFPWLMGLLWVIMTMCQQLGIQLPIEPIHELLFVEKREAVIALTAVFACVVGPIAEEVFFRGILFPAVRRHASRLVAMSITGSLFASAHTNLLGFLPIFLLGCLLADLYERTGSLLSPIVVHIAHNTLLVGISLTIRALVSG